jgi:hypothetical protein
MRCFIAFGGGEGEKYKEEKEEYKGERWSRREK